MATDDERREVARRLRGQAKMLGPNMDAHEFAHYTADVIDVNECMTWYEMEMRLADLIEPPTQCPYYRSDRHYCSIHDVPAIDRDALLALADTLGSASGELCDGCMLKDGCAGATCALGVAHEAARRIREACGEAVS